MDVGILASQYTGNAKQTFTGYSVITFCFPMSDHPIDSICDTVIKKTMGKSTRKTPIVGITTASSEKDDKRLLNRSLRRVNHQILKTDEDSDSLKQVKEVLDPWSMAKDGKTYIGPIKDQKLMRK